MSDNCDMLNALKDNKKILDNAQEFLNKKHYKKYKRI